MNNRPIIIEETANGFERYTIEDHLLRSREIFLTEDVNTETSTELIKQLMFLEHQDNTAEITLYINSPGGDVRSGMAVYDYMKLMHSPLRTVCIGLAASMGSILFLAGDKREMLEHTEIMIHDPSCNINITGKKPAEVKRILDNLMATREVIAKAIADKCNKSIDEIFDKTKDDTYFSAKEAIEYGLATKIINNIERSDANEL